MSNIKSSISELIGHTPLLALSNFAAKHGATAQIIGKLENNNPLGSVKDRLALALIEDAQERGLLGPGTTIIEPTSGNTGIGLAAIAASRGYSCIFVMPETMSQERQKLLKFFGAQLVLTEGKRGMKGSIAKAQELAQATPGAFIPGQFTNLANPAMHKKTTGPEIWQDTGGKIDIFVAGIGTGGTISGAGAYLKSRQPNLQIVAVEPADCPVLSQGRPGLHKIQGIGPGFVADTLNTEIYDEIIAVSNEDAISAAKELALTEGLLAGISSGAAAFASLQLAKRPENTGKTIVTIIPDTGERYLSTDLFA